MRLTTLYSIFTVILLLSCTKEEEALSVDKQKKNIESFLNSGRYEYTFNGGVYKIVVPAKIPSTITLEKGDSLYFYFAEYLFNTNFGKVYYTNIESIATAAGIDIANNSMKPYGIKYGKTKVLAGLEQGFNGAVQGDTLTLLITSDLAYGSKGLSIVPTNQAIGAMVIIEKIIKQQ